MNDWTPLTECVACGGARLKQYLDLGSQPLANTYPSEITDLPRYPLGLNLCLACGHSQNLGVVNPDLLYRDYPYVSGTSQTLRDYFDWFVERVEADFPRHELSPIKPRLRVLEIAANDGTLLRKFQARGHSVLGIDPAKNLDQHESLPWLDHYWDEPTANYLWFNGARYNAIVALNVLGHVANPAEFLALCKKVLAPEGRIYVQVSQARLVRYGQADTVYHEHISFFNEASFIALARRVGLNIERFQLTEIHGGSMLVELSNNGERTTTEEMETLERNIALDEDYDGFQAKVDALVARVRNQGDEWLLKYRVVGIGAAAKAMTLINHGNWMLDYIIDENPLKIGKLTPGRNIKIWGPEVVREERLPCAFVILSWNFRDELERKIREWRGTNRGDIAMVYYPEWHIWPII